MPRSKCSSAACDSFAALRRPKTGDALCKECFFRAFETEVHHTIVTNGLFKRGNKVHMDKKNYRVFHLVAELGWVNFVPRSATATVCPSYLYTKFNVVQNSN